MVKKNKTANTVATYFLGKQSGLFRPGQPLILAHVLPNAKGKTVNEPKLRTEGQKASKWRGGGAGGSVSATVINRLADVHFYLYGF